MRRLRTVWTPLSGVVFAVFGGLCLLVGANTSYAHDHALNGQPIPAPRPASIKAGPDLICSLISKAAEEYGLPKDYFARLIYKESRFDVRAVSPVGAQGVAQFMPQTAKIRGLKDPFDPRQAIPASASFLADLKARFGNFGLAAAAYNGGPDRVAKWIAKGGGWLPSETEDYVLSITFRPADWFRVKGREVEPRPLEKGTDFDTACRKFKVIATRAFGASARAPWGVQIAGGISRRAALKAFSRARRRYASVIGGRGPIVVRSKRGVRRYSARVGAPSRKAARVLCAKIRRIGGSCIVRRN
ncbi:MAG: transglycosylase SLT domain-containing protein [Pseudomonadota bacterium]